MGWRLKFLSGSHHSVKLVQSRISSRVNFVDLGLNIGRQPPICDNVAQLCQPPANFGGQLRLHPNAQEAISIRILMGPMWLPNLIFFLSEPRFKFVPISKQFSEFCQNLIACAGV